MNTIVFPEFSGVRCLMMPYIQGDPSSVPDEYKGYSDIIEDVYAAKGDIGYLTIDESIALKGKPHRGDRSVTDRALHTEAGVIPGHTYIWGTAGWGSIHKVELESDVKVLLANNVDDSCAIWNAEHGNTSRDGDIGHASSLYPYSDAILMKSGEVHEIGILTPHESLPVESDVNRQFLRIISSGVHGREDYFTVNPLLN